MTGITHVAAGVAAAGAALLASGEYGPAAAALAMVGGAAALLPDLDHPQATASRAVAKGAMAAGTAGAAWAAVRLASGDRSAAVYTLLAMSVTALIRPTLLSDTARGLFGHRGATHSLLAAALFGLLSWWLIPWDGPGAALALGAAYLSHLAMDSLTEEGASWLWPVLRGKQGLPDLVPAAARRFFRTKGAWERWLVLPAAQIGAGAAVWVLMRRWWAG